MPDISLSDMRWGMYSFFTPTLRSMYSYNPHCIDEDAETREVKSFAQDERKVDPD